MVEPKIWTFLYGSYINVDVLREVDYIPDQLEVARLAGFDIRIRPRANLVRSEQHLVYGILATGTHSELGRLYQHAKEILGETYLPEAVIAQTARWEMEACLVLHLSHDGRAPGVG
jgi:hypothetical protein